VRYSSIVILTCSLPTCKSGAVLNCKRRYIKITTFNL
jgi:hypothetical protein